MVRNKARTAVLVLGLAASQTMTSGSAFGQDLVLDSIVITGERQDRLLLETASSVSVFGEDAIERENGQAINQIIDASPNVFVRSISEAPNIRGVEGGGPGGLANTGLAGTQPRIPIIIDEIARPASTPNVDFNSSWDLESIEVFKGPQTTLRGRSAIGGAIVVKTKDPTFAPEAAFQAITTFDDFHGPTYTLNGMASGGIIDDILAVRATVEYENGDDPRNIINVPPGREGDANKLTQFDQLRLRGKVLLTPGGNGGALRILGLVDYQTGTVPQTRATVSGPDFKARDVDFFGGGLRLFDTDAITAGLDVTYDIADDHVLRLISSYSRTTFESRPEQSNNLFFDFREEIFNQDILYTIGDTGDAFRGVIGATFTRRTQDGGIDNIVLPILPPGVAELATEGTEKTYSAFVDLRFRLTGWVDVLAGGRVLHEDENRFTFSNLTSVPPFFNPPVTQIFDDKETVFLPYAGLQFTLDDQQTVSLTAREGWSSGGAAVNFFSGQPYTFRSERVWTYEATYRFVSVDQRISIGATAFYSDYTNPQFFLELQPGNRFSIQVVNLGASETYGLEMDAKAVLNDQIRIFGGLGLLKTKVTRSIPTNPALEGNRIGKDPNVTVSAGFVWTPVFLDGLSVDGKIAYIGNFFNDFNNLPDQKIGDYALVDLGISYEFKGVTGRFFIQNLTNETGLTTLVSQVAEVTPPRTFGLSIKGTF